jgi:hypothetical protein
VRDGLACLRRLRAYARGGPSPEPYISKLIRLGPTAALVCSVLIYLHIYVHRYL